MQYWSRKRGPWCESVKLASNTNGQGIPRVRKCLAVVKSMRPRGPKGAKVCNCHQKLVWGLTRRIRTSMNWETTWGPQKNPLEPFSAKDIVVRELAPRPRCRCLSQISSNCCLRSRAFPFNPFWIAGTNHTITFLGTLDLLKDIIDIV